MTLEDYISWVLKQSPENVDIEFTVNLNSYGSVSDETTGNVVKFTATNIKKDKDG